MEWTFFPKTSTLIQLLEHYSYIRTQSVRPGFTFVYIEIFICVFSLLGICRLPLRSTDALVSNLTPTVFSSSRLPLLFDLLRFLPKRRSRRHHSRRDFCQTKDWKSRILTLCHSNRTKFGMSKIIRQCRRCPLIRLERFGVQGVCILPLIPCVEYLTLKFI